MSQKTTISLNFRGLKKNQLKKIDLHDKRGALDKRKHSNKNIDSDKSALNITLIDRGGAVKAVDEIIKNGYMAKTKTGKPRKIKEGANFAVTAVVQLGGRLDASNNDVESKVLALTEAHNELVERFGEKNVIHSGIHLDETNPHLHFSFVPLTADGKLSMKDVVGDRVGLTNLQKDFLKSMQARCEWADFQRKEDQSLNGLEQSVFERVTKKQKKREAELDEREGRSVKKERELVKVEGDLRQYEERLKLLGQKNQNERARLEEVRKQNQEREENLNKREADFNVTFDKTCEAVKKVSGEIGDKKIELKNREQAVSERENGLNDKIKQFEVEKSDFVEKQKIKASELVKRETRVNVRERAVSEREDNLNNQITEFEEYKSDFAEKVKIRASELDERERGVKGREDLLKVREDVLTHQIELFNVSKADLLSIRDELENQMVGVKTALKEQRLRNNAEIDKVEEDLEKKRALFVEKITRMNVKKDKGNGLEL